MAFQIQALAADLFAEHFLLSDGELAQRNIRRMTVTSKPGTPCRVSMVDAEVGETVLLLNYEHQPASTPYKASHAIFVRQDVAQARLARDEVPEVLRSRLVSLRQFDAQDMMIDADLVAGTHLAEAINRAFTKPAAAYIHLHYAKPGCFAARARRA